MTGQASSLVLLAASGFFQAAFAVPIRHFRQWRWEQAWVGQSAVANALFPLVWAALMPAPFWSRAAHLPWSHWLSSYAWGLLWGLGGVAWGLTLARLGIAFSNSFIFGVSTVAGALLPLLAGWVEPPARPAWFAVGLIVCVAGTVTIGFLRRRGTQEPLLPMPLRFQSYTAISAVALFAGFATAGYGLAFSFAFPAMRSLIASGVAERSIALVVVLPAYLGGATVAIPIGLVVAARSGTLPLFFGKHAVWNWSMVLVMGICAAATALLYGLGASIAGHPSPNVSFAVFISFLVLGGTLLGLAGGEMRGCARRVRAGMVLSACALVVGACLLNTR